MKNILFYLIFLSIYILKIYSQESNVTIRDIKELNLTIDESVSLALKNNLRFESKKINLDEKKWNMITSWNEFIPDISFGINFKRNNQNSEFTELTPVGPIIGEAYGVFPETKINPDWKLYSTLDINLKINAEMGFKINQTVLDWQKGKIDLEIAKKELIKEVKKYFYNLILINENINLLDDSIKIYESRYKDNLNKYNKGIISKYELLSTKISLENMKPYLVKAKNNYEILIINFKKILGIKEEVKIKISGIINVNKKKLNTEELISKNINNRFDFQAFYLELKLLQNKKNIYISKLTPSFFLNFYLDPTFQKDPFKDEWFGDNNYNYDNWKQPYGNFKLGISLPVDTFFPFSKIQQQILINQLNIRQKKLYFDILKNDAEVEIKALVLNINNSIELLQLLENNFDLAEEAFNLVEEGYKNGSKSLLEVEKSTLDFNNAKINLLNEKFNYILWIIDLENAINTDL